MIVIEWPDTRAGSETVALVSPLASRITIFGVARRRKYESPVLGSMAEAETCVRLDEADVKRLLLTY
jgi:hypothetical protein